MLVENVTDYAIYMLNAEGRVASWNVGAERSKGYKAEEVLGRNFSMFFVPDAVAAGEPAQELAAAALEGRYEKGGWRLRKDGSRFWALVSLTAIRRSNGELLGFAKVTRDMTTQKKSEDALKSLNGPVGTLPDHCRRRGRLCDLHAGCGGADRRLDCQHAEHLWDTRPKRRWARIIR